MYYCHLRLLVFLSREARLSLWIVLRIRIGLRDRIRGAGWGRWDYRYRNDRGQEREKWLLVWPWNAYHSERCFFEGPKGARDRHTERIGRSSNDRRAPDGYGESPCVPLLEIQIGEQGRLDVFDHWGCGSGIYGRGDPHGQILDVLERIEYADDRIGH